MRRSFWMVFVPLVLLGGRSFAEGQTDYSKIKHIILIYQENWSFDGLYGKFPGADGLDNAGDAVKQVDLKGNSLPALPQPLLDTKKGKNIYDDRFPKSMPVGPYDLSKYVPVTATTGDLVHRYYQEQVQIDGGKMDKFVAGSNNGGLVMSYFDATNLPEGKLAAQYTLCDHYFHGAFGGSFLNHIFLVAMVPPPFPDAPAKLVAQIGPDGMPIKDGAVSPDGYGINTLQSVNHPHKNNTPEDELIPSLTMPTIGDRLSDKKISWVWYAGGWDQALKEGEDGDEEEGHLSTHHQPFVYFKNYADGTAAKKEHLKDENELNAILDGKGKLPQVSFVKFTSMDDEHPKDSDVMRGQQHTADLVEKILKSKYGKDCAILITYDEHGGRWDHVAPPKVDKWGPGSRVPFIIISPFSKKGFVDHTIYTTASILKFIENRFGIKPLNDRDGKATNLDNAFDFNQGQ